MLATTHRNHFPLAPGRCGFFGPAWTAWELRWASAKTIWSSWVHKNDDDTSCLCGREQTMAHLVFCSLLPDEEV